MIHCKRVDDPHDATDGYRVLVDRLWPRGLRKSDLQLDEWCKTLAPSNELRKAFHSQSIDFTAFCEAYRDELTQHQQEGRRLASLAKTQTLTLLYAAKSTSQNHALVLADWLRQL